jgi:hypothetical protein
MSAKSKLTLALLASAALFAINPGLVPHMLSADERASAAEISLDKDASDKLDSLVGAKGNRVHRLDGANSALAPDDSQQTDNLQTSADTAVQSNVAPGENPFARTVAQPRQNVQASVAVTSQAYALDNSSTATASISGGQNPFSNQTTTNNSADVSSLTNVDKTVKVDDGALRYYAANKDLKRLGAEMRRLKSLYPDWQPPKDLFSPVANVSEQPLWDIYKTGDYAKVRAQIAQMQSTNPRWVPSDDLLLKLQLGESRTLINRAFAQNRWQEVISTAQASPSILVCGEMQVLWNVGESFAHLHNYAEAFDLYKYILTNCDDPSLRLATVQKAALVLPSKGTTSLLAFGRTLPDGTTEFENIGFDGVRRQLGEFIRQGDFTSLPPDEDLKQFADFVQRSGSGEDAALIGWYFYAQEDWKSANSWFLTAAQNKRDPKNIEGVILTLRNMDQQDSALKVARRYIKASSEVAEQYVEIIASSLTADKPPVTLSDKDLADFEKVVTNNKSALGAQALGWKYLAGDDKAKAQDWFADSVSWKPTEGGVVGLAVMASRAKDYKVLSALKNKYLKDYASLDDFKTYNTSKSFKWKKKTASSESKPKKKRLFLFQSNDS